MRLIQEGPTANNPIMLLAEAPGEQEDRLGRPFVGSSGYELDEELARAGIPRQSLFITNVCHQRPPNNDINHFFLTKSQSKSAPDLTVHPIKAVLAHNLLGTRDYCRFYARSPKLPVLYGLHQLQSDIDRIKPRLIIAMGNTALWAVTGEVGITQRRGSIMLAEGGPVTSPGTKVIPTLHPAAVLRTYNWKTIVIQDLRRAKHEATFPEVRKPVWDCVVPTRLNTLIDWVDGHIAGLPDDHPVVSDVENEYVEDRVHDGRLICLGFAADKSNAICVPFIHRVGDNPHWWPDSKTERDVLMICKDILTKHPITFHNGVHDCQILAGNYGFMPNIKRDTMIAQHIAYPAQLGGKIDPLTGKTSKSGSSYSLLFCSSMYCQYHRYWKCLKPETEILTKDGWRTLGTFIKGDKVIAMACTKDGSSNWEECEIHAEPFVGEGIRLEGVSHSCWYTPNHKIVGSAPSTKQTVWRAEALPQYVRIKGDSIAHSEGEYNIEEDILRLAIAIQADGAIDPRAVKRGKPTVQFNLTKIRKVNRLLDLCEDLKAIGINLVSYPGAAKRGRYEICISGNAVNSAIAFLDEEKKFTKAVINLPPKLLDTFLEEIPHWDGWFFGNAFYYSSKHFDNVAWAATVGSLRGWLTHIMPLATKEGHTAYKVSFKHRDGHLVKKYKEYYSGIVYCLRTSSGFFLARNDDEIFVTGNSDGRSWDSEIHSEEQYWHYNMEDCLRTYEVSEALEVILKRDALWDQYLFYMSLFTETFEMMFDGLEYDNRARMKARFDVKRQIREVQAWINTAVGHELNTGSAPQMQALFYNDYGIPPFLHRKTRKPTLDDTALEKIKVRCKALTPLIERIQGLRSLEVFKANFLDVRLSKLDKRLRSSVNIAGPETMRFSMNNTAFGEGGNLQNLPRDE